MLRVTALDNNFFRLVSYIQTPPQTPNEFVQAIHAFRNRLSLKWLEIFTNEDLESCLASVWMTLLTLSNNTNTSIRIAAFQTIGAFQFACMPYIPIAMLNSFSLAVRSITTTGPASIAIIASFLNIFAAIPTQMYTFISRTPILMHFSADMTQFIKFIPHLVPKMKYLPLEFHQILIRTLLSSFGRNPSHEFVNSLTLIVEIDPQRLVDDVMEFAFSNSLTQMLLFLAPGFISSDSIYRELLGKGYVDKLVNISLDMLPTAHSNLNDMERVCSTLSSVLRRQYDEVLVAKIRDSMQDDYPPHVKRVVYQLPTDIAQLQPTNDESAMMKSAKIRAIAPNLEFHGDVEKALEILEKFTDSSGDLLSSVIWTVTNSLEILYSHSKERTAHIIAQLLMSEKRHWVHDIDITSLLKKWGVYRSTHFFKEFESVILYRLVNYSISEHEELAKAALSLLGDFTKPEHIYSLIRLVDPFDSKSALRLIRIISQSDINYHASLIEEIIVLHNTPDIIGEGFDLLRKLNHKPTSVLLNLCVDCIARLYKSVTLNDSVLEKTMKNEPLPPLISQLETDIVANDIPSLEVVASPLLSCFRYLVFANKAPISLYCQLFRLFPDAVLDEAGTGLFSDEVLTSMIKVSNTVHIICRCLRLLKSSIDTVAKERIVRLVKSVTELQRKEIDEIYETLKDDELLKEMEMKCAVEETTLLQSPNNTGELHYENEDLSNVKKISLIIDDDEIYSINEQEMTGNKIRCIKYLLRKPELITNKILNEAFSVAVDSGSSKRLGYAIRLARISNISTIPNLTDSDVDVFHAEYSTALAAQRRATPVSRINKIAPRSLLYLVSEMEDFVLTNQSVSISKGRLETIISSEIPSQKLRGLRAIVVLLRARDASHAWDAIFNCVNPLMKAIEEISYFPVSNEISIDICTLLFSHPKFFQLRAYVIPAVIGFCFRKLQYASSSTITRLIPSTVAHVVPPLLIYTRFIDNMVHSAPMTDYAGRLLFDYANWLTKFEKNPAKKAEIEFEMIMSMQKIYLAYPSNQNADLFIDMLSTFGSQIDKNMIVFGKLARSSIPENSILSLIKRYADKATLEEKQKAQTFIKGIEDTFASKSLLHQITTMLS